MVVYKNNVSIFFLNLKNISINSIIFGNFITYIFNFSKQPLIHLSLKFVMYCYFFSKKKEQKICEYIKI